MGEKARQRDKVMSRIMVYVQDNQDGVPTFYLENPKNLMQARRGWPLTLSPYTTPFTEMRDELPYKDVVQAAGEQLYQMLSKHPAVSQALQNALADQNHTNPVCFFLDPPDADALPWEALYDPANKFFLALRSVWPIARMRSSNLDPQEEYQFEPPLRIMAILSASGSDVATRVPGKPEWESLLGGGVDRLDAAGLSVRLHVLTGEEQLKNTIDNAAQNLDWVSTDWIVDKDQVFSAIRAFEPHILHFFCHGTTELSPHLQIGSRSDWVAEKEGSIPISADELRERADPQKLIWVIALNACESATQTKDARSLVNELVGQGFPAAIGMREKAAAAHAHKFCRLFYRAVVRMLQTIPEGGPAQEIEWASALYEARRELGAQDQPAIPLQEAARASKYWTIPVLYTRPEPFKLKRMASKPGLSLSEKMKLLAERKELVGQKEKLAADSGTPQELKTGILKEFDDKIKEIDASLLRGKP
jgi:hypothetical protein